MEISKISKNMVRKPFLNEEIQIETLWDDHPCVIIFFRRFGCILCRQTAKEISTISPILTRNNIRLIGIGFDDDYGTREFMNYFAGEIYLDEMKTIYKTLNYKRHGIGSMLGFLFTMKVKNAFLKARREKISFNAHGDNLQNGGALVITAKSNGPQLLLSFMQNDPLDCVRTEDILKVLDLAYNE